MFLTRILFELPTARLREIVRARASTIRGLPRIGAKYELARALEAALTSYDSVQRALRSTSLPQYRVLTAVVVRGGEAAFSELALEVVEDEIEKLTRTIDDLETLGLAFWTGDGDQRGVFVPRGVGQHVPLPAPLRMRLEVALESVSASGLARIGKALGAGNAGTNRQDWFVAIREAVRDAAAVRRQAALLSEEADVILRTLVESGGAATLQTLSLSVDARKRRQVLDLGWTPYRYESDPRNGVEELLSRGIAFQDKAGGWGGAGLVIPIELLEALLGECGTHGLPPEPCLDTIPAEGIPLQRHDSLIRDIAYLFGFVRRMECPKTNSGVMYKTAVKNFSRGVSMNDPRYAEFVYAVAAEAGLIAAGGRKSLFAVTKRGSAWLALNPEAQRTALFHAWHGGSQWSEAFDEMLTDGKGYRGAQDAREYRDAAIQLLGESARDFPGQAISLDSLSEQAEYNWWARFHFGPEYNIGETVQSNVELIRRIAGRSLFWLGVTAVSLDGGGNPEYVALTDEGMRRLEGEAPPEEPVPLPEKFIVQPNLEVFAPPNMPAGVLHRLFTIAEPAGRGMLSLTRDSLRQALDAGETCESILDFLRAHSQTGIAQNVEYLVKEVGGRHGQIEVGHAGLYLRVDDPTLLKELEAQRNLKIGFRRNLSENIALITGDSVDDVLKTLRQAGYLPVSSETTNGARPTARTSRRVGQSEEVFDAVTRTSIAEIDSRIDWEAVAGSDGQPFPEAATESPTPKHAPSSYVEDLMVRAIEEQRCLEIIYRPSDGSSLTQRVVEPHDLAGPIVYAFCRLREDWRNFNIRCIQSARMTGETFEWRE